MKLNVNMPPHMAKSDIITKPVHHENEQVGIIIQYEPETGITVIEIEECHVEKIKGLIGC